jgi:hypothetical protein
MTCFLPLVPIPTTHPDAADIIPSPLLLHIESSDDTSGFFHESQLNQPTLTLRSSPQDDEGSGVTQVDTQVVAGIGGGALEQQQISSHHHIESLDNTSGFFHESHPLDHSP